MYFVRITGVLDNVTAVVACCGGSHGEDEGCMQGELNLIMKKKEFVEK